MQQPAMITEEKKRKLRMVAERGSPGERKAALHLLNLHGADAHESSAPPKYARRSRAENDRIVRHMSAMFDRMAEQIARERAAEDARQAEMRTDEYRAAQRIAYTAMLDEKMRRVEFRDTPQGPRRHQPHPSEDRPSGCMWGWFFIIIISFAILFIFT